MIVWDVSSSIEFALLSVVFKVKAEVVAVTLSPAIMFSPGVNENV